MVFAERDPRGPQTINEIDILHQIRKDAAYSQNDTFDERHSNGRRKYDINWLSRILYDENALPFEYETASLIHSALVLNSERQSQLYLSGPLLTEAIQVVQREETTSFYSLLDIVEKRIATGLVTFYNLLPVMYQLDLDLWYGEFRSSSQSPMEAHAVLRVIYRAKAKKTQKYDL